MSVRMSAGTPFPGWPIRSFRPPGDGLPALENAVRGRAEHDGEQTGRPGTSRRAQPVTPARILVRFTSKPGLAILGPLIANAVTAFLPH